ncbi:hypothetical protein SAMN04488511_11429 [Pedobacter suwonensis]|uniref:Uncharacterized protein n=1 Tax=Pedobacter suwonensis TaxID=332999 RepID=A0A1I0TSV6_9SPHI|nr:hypothetical protein SAMN04488511_11429 [Pedobacter suwonensis]
MCNSFVLQFWEDYVLKSLRLIKNLIFAKVCKRILFQNQAKNGGEEVVKAKTGKTVSGCFKKKISISIYTNPKECVTVWMTFSTKQIIAQSPPDTSMD